MSELNWRKSTRSNQYNCVEVALSPAQAAVRDSKDRAAGHFSVSARQWQAFLGGIRAGRFER